MVTAGDSGAAGGRYTGPRPPRDTRGHEATRRTIQLPGNRVQSDQWRPGTRGFTLKIYMLYFDREAAKSFFFYGWAIKALPPTPFELMAAETFSLKITVNRF